MPILNMVVVLIPIMLLSVEFEQMGVVNVNAPKFVTGDCGDDCGEEKPLNLSVGITPQGFSVYSTTLGIKTPVLNCQPGQDCGSQGASIAPLLTQMKGERKRFDNTGDHSWLKRSDETMQELVSSYNFSGLYNQLVQIKRQYPEETKLTLSADPQIPFALLVATMDVARYKLPSNREDGSFLSRADFNEASYQSSGPPEYLFQDVIFAVVQ